MPFVLPRTRGDSLSYRKTANDDIRFLCAQALRLSTVIAETVHKPKRSNLSRELYLEHIPDVKPAGIGTHHTPLKCTVGENTSCKGQTFCQSPGQCQSRVHWPWRPLSFIGMRSSTEDDYWTQAQTAHTAAPRAGTRTAYLTWHSTMRQR